jgi:hypothetical protein
MQRERGLHDGGQRLRRQRVRAPATITFCRVQFPSTIDNAAGTSNTVYARLYSAGFTDLTGVTDPNPLIVGAVGYGPIGDAPSTWTNWTVATPNLAYGPASPGYAANDDEYEATLITPRGPRHYAYRFSGDGGQTWTYCDADNQGNTDGFDEPGLVTPTATLFISEYVEGSSNNKAVEIYNPTASAIDLGAESCQVLVYTNGSSSVSGTVTLTGSIASGGTHIVASSQTPIAPAVSAAAQQFAAAVNFNGNDAVALRCGATTLDVIGQIGNNPGTEWGTGLTSTADNTLRRKCGLTTATPTAPTPSHPLRSGMASRRTPSTGSARTP